MLTDEGKSTAVKSLQEAVFDKIWDDTIVRIRSKGISEISVSKSLEDVQVLRVTRQGCFGS
jgi:hypothetical protein